MLYLLEEGGGGLAYSSKVFGAREASFTCECPQHTRSSSYKADTSEELSDDDDTSLNSSVASSFTNRSVSFKDSPWLWHRQWIPLHKYIYS